MRFGRVVFVQSAVHSARALLGVELCQQSRSLGGGWRDRFVVVPRFAGRDGGRYAFGYSLSTVAQRCPFDYSTQPVEYVWPPLFAGDDLEMARCGWTAVVGIELFALHVASECSASRRVMNH